MLAGAGYCSAAGRHRFAMDEIIVPLGTAMELHGPNMDKLTIKDLELRGKRVFMRVDFNVPLKDGVVTDDTRIRETLPTLKLAIEKGGRLVLASHLGRPKGGPEPKYSLQPAAKKLEELLGKPVAFGIGLRWPGCGIAEQSAGRRRSAGARKCAISSGRRKERRRVLEAVGGLVRRVICLRRVRLGPSRACVCGWHHEICRTSPLLAC